MPAPPPPRRPGPVFDDAMNFLADDDLDAVLRIVLGVTGGGPAVRLDTELPGSARTADLIARTADGIVHVEYFKDPSPDFDLRMVDYRLRLRRQYPDVLISQYVLVLGGALVPTAYSDPDTTTGAGRGKDLLSATTTLASIVLDPETIRSTMKEATMPILVRDTPLGREWMEEGRAEGERQAVLRLTALALRRRFGDDERIEPVARLLAEIPDEERLTLIDEAGSLDDLA